LIRFEKGRRTRSASRGWFGVRPELTGELHELCQLADALKYLIRKESFTDADPRFAPK
jgi:hypothetical protein